MDHLPSNIMALGNLIACAGSWRGRSVLQDPHSGLPDDSPATAVVRPILSGRFVRLDYTWMYQEREQQGSLLFGYQPSKDLITAHWIDSWHMGTVVMACEGASEDDGSLFVLGTYSSPEGPDWGWRTVISPRRNQSLRVVMHNIAPDGQEWLAVQAEYTPV